MCSISQFSTVIIMNVDVTANTYRQKVQDCFKGLMGGGLSPKPVITMCMDMGNWV